MPTNACGFKGPLVLFPVCLDMQQRSKEKFGKKRFLLYSGKRVPSVILFLDQQALEAAALWFWNHWLLDK